MATKYRSIVRAVLAAQWAIMPDKLQAICELISQRRQGKRFTKSEVAARIGERNRAQARATPGSVAMLNIFGTLAHHVGAMQEASGGISHDAIGQAFDRAVNDPNVSTIVLHIDSPGGTVAGTPELAEKIYQARSKKNIVTVFNTLGASAAYWIGTAATKVVVSPSGSVGSIGVLSVHTDDSAAQEKLGLKETVISAGKYKAEGYGALTEEAKVAIQDRVDHFYSMFVESVAKHRGTSAANVMKSFGQGRTLTAEDALAVGMVDRVATLEQVLSELGVGLASDVSRADAPAFSLEGISMNPELFGLLVRVGMCPIAATNSEAENALARFYAAQGKAKPADEAAQIVDLKAHVASPAQAPVAVTTSATPAGNTTFSATVGNGDRAGDIIAAVKLANLGPNALDFANELVGSNISLSEALRKINDKAVEAHKPVGASIASTKAEADKFKEEAKSAVLTRSFAGNMPSKVFSFQTQDYVDLKPVRASQALQSLPRLAEECLIRDGFNASAVRNLSSSQIAQLAMGVARPESFGLSADSGGPYNTSGTFSNLLMDAANVMLRRSYDEAPSSYQSWAKRADDIRDFKNVNRVIAGEIGDPRIVPEGGEFDQATMTDGKESYALRVWGQVFYISWQAVVNDQLSAFVDIPRKQGVAMRRKQNKLVYGVLKDNANLSDGGALFNATAVTSSGGHANLTTGAGAPGVSTLNALELAMAKQRGLDPAASSTLGLKPKFIMAGTALAATIDEVLGSTSYAVANGNAGIKNRWYNGLTPIIDEELGASAGGSDTQWFLAASSDQVDTVEYAYLQGMDSPSLESEASFDRLAMKYRIYQAFATKAIDFRGLQKHAGA